MLYSARAESLAGSARADVAYPREGHRVRSCRAGYHKRHPSLGPGEEESNYEHDDDEEAANARQSPCFWSHLLVSELLIF